MQFKKKILIIAILLGFCGPLRAAPASPAKKVEETFEAIKQYHSEEPTISQVAKSRPLLVSLLDRQYLQEKLLSGVENKPTAEQSKLLFTTIEEQLTIAMLKGMQKGWEKEQKKGPQKKPEVTENINEDSAVLLYKIDTMRGQREVECHFALVNGQFLFRDMIIGKKSMVNIFQKRLKKELKKRTVEEYVAHIKKHGLEMKPDRAEEQTAPTP